MTTIVCPTDFSACAENAISYAHQLAIASKAKLMLLHTIFIPEEMPYVGPYGGFPLHAGTNVREVRYLQDQLLHRCQQLKEQVPAAQVDYETRIGSRPVADEISHIATTEQIDLIVMGTSGAHGLKQLLIGSTAAQVIEMTKCPVLVVPAHAAYTPIKKIVFAADLTEEQPANLSDVLNLAKISDAQILFMHVLKEKSFVSDTMAKMRYSRLYSLIGYEKVSFHTTEEEDIEKGILQFTKQVNADLLVMINHHRNFWESLFKRSQTKQLAYHSTIPLLAIHG